MNELQSQLQKAIDDPNGRIRLNPTRTEWNRLLISASNELISQFDGVVSPKDVAKYGNNASSSVRELLGQLSRLGSNPGEKLLNISRMIRQRSAYTLLTDSINSIRNNTTDRNASDHDFAVIALHFIYMGLCEPNRFLVGSRNGFHWKDVEIESDNGILQFIQLSTAYLPLFSDGIIGNEELTVVPRTQIPASYMRMENRKCVYTPGVQTTIPENLEDAFYRQRYVLPREGAEVFLPGRGDVTSMYMIQRGNTVLSRVDTRLGQTWVQLDLNTATWFEPSHVINQAPIDAMSTSYRVALLAADVYHDLVTAEEITVSNSSPRELQRMEDRQPHGEDGSERPYIYIARRIKRSQDRTPREPLIGESRPIRPHSVTGHWREANMTPQHRERLRVWQEETGVELPERTGFTFVRPHFVPAEPGQMINQLPLFIKRRISDQLSHTTPFSQ